MQPTRSLLVLLTTCLWALPCHALAHRHNSDGSFSVTLSPKRSPHRLSHAALIAKTAAKYGFNVSSDPIYRVYASKGTVPTDPTSHDEEYLAPVYIGEQLVYLDFDTGSSDTWVYSAELAQTQQVSHNLYNPNASSTAKAIPHSSWEVDYGDGSVAAGTVYTDCVDVGGTAVENQGVGVATEVSGSFNVDPTDGLLGLGFSSVNGATPRQNTFLDNAIRQGLALPVMAIDLHHDAPGTYDFGYIDRSKYSGPLVYAPVDNSTGYWLVNLTGWSFGEGVSRLQSSPKWFAPSVIDTGTSITFLNLNIVRGYWATVPGSEFSNEEGGYIAPCNETYPDFTFRIGDFTVTVPGSTNKYAVSHYNSSMCFGGLQSNEFIPFDILGDTFLKHVFAVLDMGNPPRAAFAHKAVVT